MAINVPSRRPTRIDSSVLGMFSLDDTARTHEIDEVSLAQLQKLTNSIAQVFTAPSIETLERQLGLSPIASGSTSNEQDANFPVTRGNKLSFAQRRDNVIDALFDQSSFSQRRIAISILDNADRATQAKYSQKVKKYVREAIKENGLTRRSAIELLDRIEQPERDKRIAELLVSKHFMTTNKLFDYFASLNLDERKRYLRSIFMDELPYSDELAEFFFKNIDESFRIDLTKDMLKICDDKIKLSRTALLLSTLSSGAQLLLADDINNASKEYMPLLSECCSEVKREIFLQRIKKNDPLWISQMQWSLRTLVSSDQYEVLNALTNIPDADVTRLIDAKGNRLEPLYRHRLIDPLLNSHDIERRAIGVEYARDMGELDFLSIRESILQILDESILGKDSDSFDLKEYIDMFTSHNGKHIIAHIIENGNALEKNIALDCALNLEEDDRLEVISKHETVLAQFPEEILPPLIVALLSHLPNNGIENYLGPIDLSIKAHLLSADLSTRLDGAYMLVTAPSILLTKHLEEFDDILHTAFASEDAALNMQAISISNALGELLKAEQLDGCRETLKNLVQNADAYISHDLAKLIIDFPSEHGSELDKVIYRRFCHFSNTDDPLVSSGEFKMLATLPESMQLEALSEMVQKYGHDVCQIQEYIDAVIKLPPEHQANLLPLFVLHEEISADGAQEIWGAISELPNDLAIDVLRKIMGYGGQKLLDPEGNRLKVITGIIERLSPEQKAEAKLFMFSDPSYLTSSNLHDLATDQETALNKSGSGTTILPKNDEASVRHVDIDTAHTWANAYLAASAWKEAGFDYIPVEPIIGISSDGSEIVDVVTVNLRGRAYYHSDVLLSLYSPEIANHIKQIHDSIVDTLNDLGLAHGHLHEGNFVIVPETDAQGNIDFDVCPRVYVIDFDRAQIQRGAPLLDASSSSSTVISNPLPTAPSTPQTRGF